MISYISQDRPPLFWFRLLNRLKKKGHIGSPRYQSTFIPNKSNGSTKK